MRANDVTVEVVDQDAAPLDLRPDDPGDGRLAGTGQPGEPEGEALSVLVHAARSFLKES
jgi:hypothetical protein